MVRQCWALCPCLRSVTCCRLPARGGTATCRQPISSHRRARASMYRRAPSSGPRSASCAITSETLQCNKGFSEEAAMTFTRAGLAAALMAGLACLVTGPAAAQDDQENVPLIMLKSPSTAAFGSDKLRKMYAAIKKRAGKATRTVLPLTKAEVWSVPKQNVGAVKKAAARYGAAMQQLGATWNHVFQKLRADTPLTARQRSIADQARTSAAVVAVGTMGAPPPPMVEYALIKEAGSARAANITVALGDQTTLTLTRVSVDIKPDMCIWRGTVDGTGEPATILWWP